MFTGEYLHSIDLKNRLIIPSRMREELGATFFVTKGSNHCLFGFPAAAFDELCESLRHNALNDPASQKLLRVLFTGAVECELDKQGRILLPQNLRAYAGLDRDVYVVGVNTRIEIWSKEAWEQFITDASDDFDTVFSQAEPLRV